jgi:hypothetical protein
MVVRGFLPLLLALRSLAAVAVVVVHMTLLSPQVVLAAAVLEGEDHLRRQQQQVLPILVAVAVALEIQTKLVQRAALVS